MIYIFLLVSCFGSACLAFHVPTRDLPIIPAPIPFAGRIIGGEIATIEDVPYQVVMLYGGSLRCGGSIVKVNAVITAAHCTNGYSASFISIRAGSSNHDSGGQILFVGKVFQHESFNPNSIDYDITLLQLSSFIEFGSSAKVIDLPAQNLLVPSGSIAQTSGWGAILQGGSISSVIRKVVIPIVDQEVCNMAYTNHGYQITPRMICAGLLEEGGKDACQGDSGGPLVVDNTLVGVTSWGYGCARPGFPGVWSRVPEMRNWIDDKFDLIESV